MLSHRFRGALAALVAIFVWSAAPSVVKLSLSQMDTSTLLCLRFLASFLFALPWQRDIWKKRTQIPARAWVLLFAVLGANFYLQTVALGAIPVGVYVVVFSLNPILTLLLLRAPLGAATWLSIVAALAGAMLFIDLDGMSSVVSASALFAMLGGMLAWSGYTVLVIRFQRVYSDIEIASLTSSIGLISSSAIWLLVRPTWTSPPASGMALVVALGLMLPVAFFCYAYALRRVQVFAVAGQYLEPVFGVLLAVAFFRERLTGSQVLGLAIVVVAMGALSATRKSAASPDDGERNRDHAGARGLDEQRKPA